MRILLDTHIFIWWNASPERLSRTILAACQDPTNTLILSVVSLWEMQIKLQLGKFKLQDPLTDVIHQQQRDNGIELLPVFPDHIYALDRLQPIHKDPFDRLLIAQALFEDLTVASNDAYFTSYPITLLK